jgi:hypothetical protein
VRAAQSAGDRAALRNPYIASRRMSAAGLEL